ncbi:hypothetical protein PHJA_001772900 [Phtheirospermum japonicum]|uniref:Uncharacterized protein n=1 Tax=Phtheirospermum japonicum TaxID=374723 RepID=A0A830CGU4_9LAMI|nr:hypothetical protein PHJA_001772900 [Phtheirospermum japonicum]
MKTFLTNINLQDKLTKLLVSEKHHKCTHYLLKILYTLNSVEFQDGNQLPSLGPRYICNMDCNSIFRLWDELITLFKITRHAKTQQTLASNLLAHADALGSLISSYPISDEAIGLYARKLLDLWSTKTLALDVQKFFVAKNSSQVEKVIELCFDHLSRIFGHWPANGAGYVVSGGDLVRRVFDKEIDNHHEEKLLICQICCSHLEIIPVSKSEAEGDLLLRKWRTRFFEQLKEFARDRVGKRGSADWFGGVGNHKDAFLPIYANLLAFYSLSNCILREGHENGGDMVSEVYGLGEAIEPFLGNPLISNLYLMVVKSHENYLGGNADNLSQKWRDRGSVWDEFNPYFLLR